MFTAYIFCLAVGGGLLALSLFGDALDTEVDVGVDDLDVDVHGGDVARLLSLRTLIYASFGFGAVGALLTTLWDGGRPIATGVIATTTGLASGLLISTLFRFLKVTDSGAQPEEMSFVGLTGEVALDITLESLGSVSVQRGMRRYRIRAKYSAADEVSRLAVGAPIVVVGMESGIALVTPVDVALLGE